MSKLSKSQHGQEPKKGFQGSLGTLQVSQKNPKDRVIRKVFIQVWLRQEYDTITPPTHYHFAPAPVFPWTFWPLLVSLVSSSHFVPSHVAATWWHEF
jgi:hypothetical protein